MLYLFKPLPANDRDFSNWKPFIKNVWFRRNFPMIFLLLTDGFVFELLRYILCVNAIIAGSDIINSILIAVKPSNVKFCGGYYIDSRNT